MSKQASQTSSEYIDIFLSLPEYIHPSVAATFELSVADLPPPTVVPRGEEVDSFAQLPPLLLLLLPKKTTNVLFLQERLERRRCTFMPYACTQQIEYWAPVQPLKYCYYYYMFIFAKEVLLLLLFLLNLLLLLLFMQRRSTRYR